MKRFLRKRLIWAWAIIGACLIIALPGVLAATASSSQSPPRPSAGLRPGTQFTPVVASTLTTPEPVRGSDGRIHLAYELLLTNATAFPVRISQVEVLDASTHRTLLSLTGNALHGELTPIGAPNGDEGTDDPAGGSATTTMPSSATWIVWLDVSLPAGRAVPRHLEHRVAGEIVLLGRVPTRIWDDNLGLQPTGTLPFVPAKPVAPHHDELPLDRAVVRFSGS